MKKLLIFTDTYKGQINGVTRCLESLSANIAHDIHLDIISSDDFVSIPFLGYREIRLSFAFPRQVWGYIEDIQPDAIHIMTEGPVGLTAAYICQNCNIPYTTTFHTKFPEYLHIRSRIMKEQYIHQYLHYIHNGAQEIFISNPGLIGYLSRHNYRSGKVIPFGVDSTIFFPGKKSLFNNIPSPILLYVGRIAVEKNVKDFLNMQTTYQKIVVGDGPLLESYRYRYRNVLFLGNQDSKRLGDIYRSATAFVFPSKTDTLGLVNLEAMASDLPIIAYDLDITRGIIQNGITGILVPEGSKLETAIPRINQIIGASSGIPLYTNTWLDYAREFVMHQVSISFPIHKDLWVSNTV